MKSFWRYSLEVEGPKASVVLEAAGRCLASGMDIVGVWFSGCESRRDTGGWKESSVALRKRRLPCVCRLLVSYLAVYAVRCKEKT